MDDSGNLHGQCRRRHDVQCDGDDQRDERCGSDSTLRSAIEKFIACEANLSGFLERDRHEERKMRSECCPENMEKKSALDHSLEDFDGQKQEALHQIIDARINRWKSKAEERIEMLEKELEKARHEQKLLKEKNEELIAERRDMEKEVEERVFSNETQKGSHDSQVQERKTAKWKSCDMNTDRSRKGPMPTIDSRRRNPSDQKRSSQTIDVRR